jgi:putative addiction module component (TIGR02574 family)
MTVAAEKLAEKALALPLEDRADLADRLVQSLDAGSEFVWRDQWNKEALRRLDEVRSGAVRLVPGRAAMDELRRKLGA